MNDIQEQIVNELAEDMCSQIDFEILSDILIKSCGWQLVDLERFNDHEQTRDIIDWLQKNIKGHWQRKGSKFLFEHSRDANWFTLRWT